MPRVARKMSSTGTYHVMIRGNNRQKIFLNWRDNKAFCDILKRIKAKFGFKIYAYALMVNHVHLLVNEPELGLVSAFMHDLETAYVNWFNAVHRRSGHLFQGRFKSVPVEDNAYFANVLRYIHQNPVKSGLCIRPDDYEYSSYRDYLTDDPAIVDPGDVFEVIDRAQFAAFNNEELSGNDLKFLKMNEFVPPRVPDELAPAAMRSISQCIDAAQLRGLGLNQIFLILKKFRKRGLSYRQIAEFLICSKSTVFRLANSFST